MIQCVASTIMKLDTSTKMENNERMKRQEEGAQSPGGKDEFTPQRNGGWNLAQKDSSKSKDDASEVEWRMGRKKQRRASRELNALAVCKFLREIQNLGET